MTNKTSPQSLIINSPYLRPTQHWHSEGGKPILTQGRRPAGYEIYDTRTQTKRVEPLELVNQIRQRVDGWRAAGYEGASTVSLQLLEHWHDKGDWDADSLRWVGGQRDKPFYFCQLEAIETLIWWVEAYPTYKQGIVLQGDGGAWERVCNKMATGSGKTSLMAMIITWQTLNALANPKDTRFSKAIFIVAPGLTVKSRLQVLLPSHEKNVYDEFHLCPASLRERINQAEILIENWHTLMPKEEQTRSVVKKGKESDEAYTKRVLGALAQHKNLIVINDEAHHAYRVQAESKISKKEAEEQGLDLDQATRWIEGLDRIHKTRRILRCFDLSATPFAPTGKKNTETGLYTWIVSDFGLNDAIEAGLVKTPRVVIRDTATVNAATYRSKLYHLYREEEVSEDFNQKPALPPTADLPDLVEKAYALLAHDWQRTAAGWGAAGRTIPPVMLTVCNRTEVAARIEDFFNRGDCAIADTKAPLRTLRVDSKVLERAETGETSSSKDKAYAEHLEQIIRASGTHADYQQRLLNEKQEIQLRELVDTVGKRGKAGQCIQNVISVAMLSEGWDAANVTHIMGLRAFTSQLLCEQVIGRGLRRVSHDLDEHGLLIPEYVNIFGVPLSLSIFQDTQDGGIAPPPPKPSTRVEVEPERHSLQIKWPNIVRIESVMRQKLSIDWSHVAPLTLDPMQTPLSADITPSLTGAPHLGLLSKIDLEQAADDFRMQFLIFKAARRLYFQTNQQFDISKTYLAQQLVGLVEEFLHSDLLVIPSDWHQDDLRKRLLIGLNMGVIVGHLSQYLHEQNLEKLAAIFAEPKAISSTADMQPWQTTRACMPTQKSQISHVVYDSTWEKTAADLCEEMPEVLAWVKNDHLDFSIRYLWKGATKLFIPDYLIRLTNGKTLVLEIKGQDSDKNRAKRLAMQTWVEAVNEQGAFGHWCFDVVFEPAKIRDTITRHLT